MRTINLLKANQLIGWSRQKEQDLQKALSELSSEWKMIDGINTKLQVSEKDYPIEIKNLIKERKKSLSVPLFKLESQ